ncbi:MAG TPA: hypothetical protein VN922_01490, partial [Bacteroidia bacterium]|nr:hypothetical protein [Bacteroidia bacterium]
MRKLYKSSLFYTLWSGSPTDTIFSLRDIYQKSTTSHMVLIILFGNNAHLRRLYGEKLKIKTFIPQNSSTELLFQYAFSFYGSNSNFDELSFEIYPSSVQYLVCLVNLKHFNSFSKLLFASSIVKC